MMENNKDYDPGVSSMTTTTAAAAAVEEPEEPTNNYNSSTSGIEFEFIDHFSLKQPSSSVRSRGITTRVYDLANDQLQLDHTIVKTTSTDADATDDYNNNHKKSDTTTTTTTGNNNTTTSRTKIQLTMHRLRGGNMGLCILRTGYTLVALLMAGFMFVLTANIIIMQAMEIPRNSGQADGYVLNVPVMMANILSLPLLVYSMASVMVFASVFVSDVWKGHVLFSLLLVMKGGNNTTTNNNNVRVYMEWYSFILYMGIPLLSFSIASFAGKDNWQEIGTLTWYICMLISFIIFSALIFYREMVLSLDLARIMITTSEASDNDLPITKWQVAKHAILKTLEQRYSGREEQQYLTRESVQQETENDNFRASIASSTTIVPIRTYRSLYSRITTTQCANSLFFHPIIPPRRQYSIAEIRETIPIVTHTSWSLSKMCCSWRGATAATSSHSIMYAVAGPNALDSSQFLSTLVCTIVGVILGIIMVAAVCHGLGQGIVILIAAIVIAMGCYGIPCIWSAIQFYKTMPRDDNDDAVEEDEDAMPVYQAWSSFTVSKPKEWYCWFRLFVVVVFLFLWPLVAMFTQRLFRVAILFSITSVFTIARQLLDAGSILSEQYSLSKVPFSINNNSDERTRTTKQSIAQAMVTRARVSELIGKITNSVRIWFWVSVFGIMGAYFIYSGITSAGTGEDFNTQTGREPIRMLNDFYYPRQSDSMLYPVCQLTNQYALPGMNNTYVTDYNLLAGLAYETTEVNKYVLDKWFLVENNGTAAVIDEAEYVTQWRQDSGNSLSQVSFKLYSFPTAAPGVGILSIRGTETALDALFNIQLYCGTVLTMLVRYAMPFSWIWDSIYDDLLARSTWVASENLQKSEYYRITTDFVNEVLLGGYTVNGKSFNWLRTTGVSLGGGLALITGAQTDAWAFAFSGPNPTLGRKGFTPPITMDQLKEKVFNNKPTPDLVSSLGDLVPNHQLVRCRTWPAKVTNCHSFWRIMCEYMYTCGSSPDRAGAMCVCVEKWGYPEPIQRGGNLTFSEACAQEEEIMIEELGDIFGSAE